MLSMVAVSEFESHHYHLKFKNMNKYGVSPWLTAAIMLTICIILAMLAQ
jgi:hypothetical protein